MLSAEKDFLQFDTPDFNQQEIMKQLEEGRINIREARRLYRTLCIEELKPGYFRTIAILNMWSMEAHSKDITLKLDYEIEDLDEDMIHLASDTRTCIRGKVPGMFECDPD
ncbi:hypothetical protein KKA95_03585 [Patescibacteria group bacterium]|nr:hypothetical protein [Patescibacteria group bacterium]